MHYEIIKSQNIKIALIKTIQLHSRYYCRTKVFRANFIYVLCGNKKSNALFKNYFITKNSSQCNVVKCLPNYDMP